MYFKAKKTTLIEVQISAAVVSPGKVNFTDQPYLRTDNEKTVTIEGIEVLSVQALAISPLSTLAVANAVAIRNATLTLDVEGSQDFQNIPLASLNRVIAEPGANFVPGVFDLFALHDIKRINWQKSFVTLNAAPAGTPFSYLFQVYYSVSAGAKGQAQRM